METGAVLAETPVARWHAVTDRAFLNRVSVTFEIDPSQLPDVVRSLAAVIAEAEPSSLDRQRFRNRL